jgi:hypothetical protein
LRGKALREILLCQKVPDPPGDVDFNIVQDTENSDFKTVRQRLDAHAGEPMCVGCHKITDPMGLALENFDAIGGFRKVENGTPIDTSGALDGVSFDDATELGRVVRNHPATTTCFVNRVFSYGVGRSPTNGEKEWLDTYLIKAFGEEGYQLPQLFRRIATNDTFFRISSTEVSANAPAMASVTNFKLEN